VRFEKLAAVGLAGALFLTAACGSDDDDEATDDNGGNESSGQESGGFTAPDSEIEATLRVWLNGPDTPQTMRDYAIETFKEQYPNVSVEIEEQEWDGIVPVLTNALAADDSPDIVEMGNTQAQGFEAAGALVDLTPAEDDLGGDDLLDSLKEAGTYDGKLFALPLYAGARVVTYRTDLFEAAGIEVPTTMQEFVDAGTALQEANASTANFSGIYFPGRNWQAMLSFIWDAGGDIATQDGGEWTGTLADEGAVEGLTQVQDIMTNANQAPADSDDRNDYIEFCAGEIGMLMGPGWKGGQIEEECPEMVGKLGVFPLPGAEEAVAPSFLGGSVLGVSAKSENPDLAVEFLELISSEGFQAQYAEAGLIPNQKAFLELVTGSPAAEAQAAAAANSRFTPSSEYWAEVEGADILQDMGTAIANGDDVEEAAQTANDAIVEILNQ